MSDTQVVASATVPTIFQFGSHEVRIIMRDGEPWFIASEVAQALGYRDAANASRNLADHQKADTQIVSTSSNGTQQARTVTIINESGLYRLVLRSRKPEAEKFTDWVTGEVLPAIRKTGSYTKFKVNPTDTLTLGEQDTLRNLLQSAADLLPKDQRAKFLVQGWSKLKAHFSVPYRQIPRGEFTVAVNLISRHTAEWEVVEEHKIPDTGITLEKVRRAMLAASEVSKKVERDVFEKVLAGDSFGGRERWMVSVDVTRDGLQGFAKHVDPDAFVMTLKTLVYEIAEGSLGPTMTNDDLALLAKSSVERLSNRMIVRHA